MRNLLRHKPPSCSNVIVSSRSHFSLICNSFREFLPFDFCCFSVLQTRIPTTCRLDLRTTMSCKVTVKPLQTLVQGIQQVSRCITSQGIRLNPTNCNRGLVFYYNPPTADHRGQTPVAFCWSTRVLHRDSSVFVFLRSSHCFFSSRPRWRPESSPEREQRRVQPEP